MPRLAVVVALQRFTDAIKADTSLEALTKE